MTKSEQAHLKIQAGSHEGMRGKQNEDRFAVKPFLSGEAKQVPSVIAVVCDGIGGHRAGEVAAEMGVSIITDDVINGDADQPLKTIEQAIIHANSSIYQASQADLGRSGMGATCACAWVLGDRLYTANLGDSRIYLLRANHLIQLTTDHTWIQEAYDAGLISNKNLGDHPNAHVIRRYLGSQKPPEPDFRMWVYEEEQAEDALANQGLAMNPGDMLLLCSDGLTDLVSDKEIQKVLQNSPLESVPDILIDMANQRGGHDNITVVVMQIPQKKKRKKRLLAGCLFGLVVISLVITAIIIGLRWRETRMEKVVSQSPAFTLTITKEIPKETVSPTLIQSASLTATLETSVEIITPGATHTPWPTNTLEP